MKEKETIFIMCKPQDYAYIASDQFNNWLMENRIDPEKHNLWLPYAFCIVHPLADIVKTWNETDKINWFRQHYPILSKFYSLSDLENMLTTTRKEFTLEEKLNDAKEKLNWIKNAQLVNESYETTPDVSDFVSRNVVEYIATESFEPNLNEYEIILRHNLKKQNLDWLTPYLVKFHAPEYQTFLHQLHHMILDFTPRELHDEKEELNAEIQYAVENHAIVHYDLSYEEKRLSPYR